MTFGSTMHEPSVLIVEDESIVAMEIAAFIRQLGYRVAATAADSRRAQEMARQHRPDLILMDITLKGERDGIETVTAIREMLPAVRVIYLTAFTDADYIERAVATGPSAYLSKPVNRPELQAAMKIALAEAVVSAEAAALIVLDHEFTYDPDRRQLDCCHTAVPLTKRENELLALLIASRNRVVDIYTVESVIWPDREPNESRRRALVSRLRSKLKHRFIETHPGIGYRLKTP